MTALRPDVLGVSATTISIGNGARIAAAVKAKLPHVTTVVGGPHVSAVPEATLAALRRSSTTAISARARSRSSRCSTRSRAAGRRAISGRRRPRRATARVPRQLPRALPRRPRSTALPGLGAPRRRLPAPLRAVDLQLSLHAGRDAGHLARAVRSRARSATARRPGKLGRCHSVEYVDRDVPHVGRTRRPPRHVLRRPLHGEEEARDRALRGDRSDAASASRGAATAIRTCSTSPTMQLMKRAGCWQIAYGVESGSQRVLNVVKHEVKLADACATRCA